MSESHSLSVAIVGAGSMAREHIRAFQDVPGVKVAGITSRTREKATALAAEFGIPVVCDSVDELYRTTQAGLVVVTVFEMAMRNVAVDCCRHPWTLMLEKPPGKHQADAEAIRDAAVREGRRVIVALNRRFLASTQAAATDLESDAGPRYIHVQDQQDQGLAQALNHPPEVVANWMFANSIHLMDYLRFFGRGRITKVTPVAEWNANAPGIVLARVDFSSGDLGLYEGIWRGPGPWAVSVTTPAKRWEMRPLEQAQHQVAGIRKWNVTPPADVDARFKPGFRLQAEHAVAAALGRPSCSPSLDEAIETMRLIHDAFGLSDAPPQSRAA